MTADYSVHINEVDAAKNPSVDIGNDGTTDVSYSGVLSDGESKSFPIDPSLSDDTWGVSSTGSPISISADVTETVVTQDAGAKLNGEWVNVSGQLSEGEQVSRSFNASDLQEGTNTLTIDVGDGSLSSDAPAPQVGVEYQHSATAKVSTTYAAERWSERYNISKTFAGVRESASATIPFEGQVADIRSIEVRINGSGWQSVATSHYQLDGTTLSVDVDGVYGSTIPAGSSVEIRAVGSRVHASGGTIQVVEPTVKAEQLDSKIEVTDRGSGPLEIATADPTDAPIPYTYDESWTTADEYVRAGQSSQSLVLPSVEAGDSFRVSTIPVTASPATAAGDVDIRVSDPAQATPQFSVSEGGHSGDSINYTFTGAQDGTSYILYSQTRGVVLDSGTASSPLTLTGSDSAGTIEFQRDSSSSSVVSSDGPGIMGPVRSTSTSLLSALPAGLLRFALFGGVLLGGVYGVSRWWSSDGPTQSRSRSSSSSSTSSSASSTTSRLASIAKRGGGLLSTVLAGVLKHGASGVLVVLRGLWARVVASARWLISNPRVTGVLGGVAGVALIATGAIPVPAGTLPAVFTVGAPLGSYVLLGRIGDRSMLAWGVMAGISVVIGLVWMGVDLFGQLLNQQVSIVIAVGGLYIAYELVQAYQSPEKVQRFVFRGNDGSGSSNRGDQP